MQINNALNKRMNKNKLHSWNKTLNVLNVIILDIAIHLYVVYLCIQLSVIVCECSYIWIIHSI